MHRFKDVICRLAAALNQRLSRDELTTIDEAISEFYQSDDDAVPTWLLEVLDAWSSGNTTGDWTPFELVAMEASDALQFLAELPRWLPIAIDNQGERWTLTSPQLPDEAIIAFEGYLYLIKPVGTPEPRSAARES